MAFYLRIRMWPRSASGFRPAPERRWVSVSLIWDEGIGAGTTIGDVALRMAGKPAIM